MALECLLRRHYDPAALFAAHPPKLRHAHKQRVFDVLVPAEAVHAGELELTRWAASPLPAAAALFATSVEAVASVFDYAGPDAGVWHVNFADPHLFFGYGTQLLAQDELQALEHPALGPLREALLAEGDSASCEASGVPMPVLVADVERRGRLDTTNLYGGDFAAAGINQVLGALTVLTPPPRSHLIAIAAPRGGRGRYRREELAVILQTALTGFSAAAAESRRRWPGVPVEIRTGFWGCGAFGGNRRLMTLMQLLAARLAGVDRLRFHTVSDGGLRDFTTGAEALDSVLAAGAESLDGLLGRIDALGYYWGSSNGT